MLNATDYSTQTAELNNKITELRIERRKKLAEDEDDELLEQLKDLEEMLAEYLPQGEFDERLFEGIVEKIMVDDNTKITFKLIGGVELTEKIIEKGRCKSL